MPLSSSPSASVDAQSSAAPPSNAQDVRAAWPDTHLDQWMDPSGEPGLASVIVPTYNRSHLILDALKSVWEQDYRPIELIVVDDGSSDDTEAVVTSWIEDHDTASHFRARYVRQENRGGSAARNRGLVESRGEYIQFLDSDDILHPRKISFQVSALETSPPCRFVFSGLKEFQDEDWSGPPDSDASPPETLPLHRAEDDLTNIPGNALAGLYRRSDCVRAGPWNETLTLWDDVEYMLRHRALFPSYRQDPRTRYFMRVHGGERLQDFSQNTKGIEEGLRAADAMVETAETIGLDMPEIRRSIANFYLSRFRAALTQGTPQQVYKASGSALEQRTDTSFQLLLNTIIGVYKLAGGHAARSVLNAYSHIRVGTPSL